MSSAPAAAASSQAHVADPETPSSARPLAALSSAPARSGPSNSMRTRGVRLIECGPLGGERPQVEQQNKAANQHQEWACTPAGQWVRVFTSSVSSLPNRERDKTRVEETLGLPEFGDSQTELYAVRSGLVPIAVGYDRVVYGDHGPYVELSADQICWSSFPCFVEKPRCAFFDECWTADAQTMLYAQRRPVCNKPNPPNGMWSAQNNRPEGYANYLAGKYYISCDSDTLMLMHAPKSRRRKRNAKKKGSSTGASSISTTDPDSFENEAAAGGANELNGVEPSTQCEAVDRNKASKEPSPGKERKPQELEKADALNEPIGKEASLSEAAHTDNPSATLPRIPGGAAKSSKKRKDKKAANACANATYLCIPGADAGAWNADAQSWEGTAWGNSAAWMSMAWDPQAWQACGGFGGEAFVESCYQAESARD